MKLGLFSDVHFCREQVQEGNRRCSLSFDKLKAALPDLRDRKVDLLICMGDFSDINKAGDRADSQECLKDMLREIRASGLDFLLVPGNHDFLVSTVPELEAILGPEASRKLMDTPEYRLIVLDGNYRSDGSHYDPSGFDWTDTNLPSEQLAFLQSALNGTDKECIVLVHEPLDPESGDWYRVNNADEVRSILESSGKVRLVLQGHMHEYGDVTVNGIRYVTIVGMCEGTKNRYAVLEKTDKEFRLDKIERD